MAGIEERWGVWCEPKGSVNKAQWLSDYAGIDAASKPSEFPTEQAAEECAARSRLRNASWTYEPRVMLVPAERMHWENVDDEWTKAIAAAHPMRIGSHEEYATAMRMVGHRHSKGELVALVTWLLVENRKLRSASR